MYHHLINLVLNSTIYHSAHISAEPITIPDAVKTIINFGVYPVALVFTVKMVLFVPVNNLMYYQCIKPVVY